MPGQRGVFPLVPIVQIDVYASIRNQLMAMLESGQYRAGDRLPSERELSTSLQVSRVAVREALKVLESAGRVRIRHGAGVFVAYTGKDPVAALLRPATPVDRSGMAELIETRAAIEVKIVELAGRRVSPKDLRSLETLLVRNEVQSRRTAETGSLNLLFEAQLALIAGNTMLISLQRALHELWVAGWSDLGVTPDRKDVLHEEHVKILEALRSGDTNSAVEQMVRHVDREIGG